MSQLVEPLPFSCGYAGDKSNTNAKLIENGHAMMNTHWHVINVKGSEHLGRIAIANTQNAASILNWNANQNAYDERRNHIVI